MMIQTIINTLIQLFLFTLIPFIWWIITTRKKQTFFSWIGIKKPIITNNKKFLFIIILLFATNITLFFITPLLVSSSLLATNQFSEKSISTVVSILLWAIIQTGLSEEILFRGFLLKRLSNKFGFLIGNIIQAIIFGLIHGVPLFSTIGLIKAMIITIITGLFAWLSGYLDERLSGGSILPSWLIHSVTNIISGIVQIL